MVHRSTPLASAFRAYVSGGARSVVHSITDTTQMQEMMGAITSGEKRKRIEAPQNYGFTSVNMDADQQQSGGGGAGGGGGKSPMGPEAFISYLGGGRQIPIAQVIDDRRHRLKGLDKGDVAMFRTAAQDLMQQFHLTQSGGFWSTVDSLVARMHLVPKQQQQGGQSGGGGQRDTSGGGGSGSSGSGQQQKQMGQSSMYKDGQKSPQFFELTKDKTRIGHKGKTQIVEGASGGGGSQLAASGGGSDGTVLMECSSGKHYCGGTPDKDKFALIVTVKGPTKNVPGKIG